MQSNSLSQTISSNSDSNSEKYTLCQDQHWARWHLGHTQTRGRLPTHLLDVRSAEDIKVLGGQVAGPAVKDLDHLCTCISLWGQCTHTGCGAGQAGGEAA
jgi:hypothetical protein